MIDIDQSLRNMADRMRLTALKLAHSSGKNASHVGPGLSIIDVLAVLYGSILKIDKNEIESEYRDRFILSKEHGVLAYYAALYEIGILSDEDLSTFMKTGSFLLGHPVKNRQKGIEFTSGSLGMGLSLAIGVAIGLKRKKINNQVYVLVGDGECNEGSIWEGIMSAAHFDLDNLTLIIDSNGIQLGGKTEETMNLNNLSSTLSSFGWDVYEVDGHDTKDLERIFKIKNKINRPKAIIAKTVKGKGISFMENNIDWHHNILTDNLYTQALKELRGEIDVK